MSGTKMYALKPIVTQEKLGNCVSSEIYEMKNIHECTSDEHASRTSENVMSQKVIDFLKSPLAEVVALEARQEKILAQLAELNEQILGLCDVLKFNSANTETQTKSVKTRTHAIALDLTVNANPLRPCWSLKALEQIWSDVNFVVTRHVHSSVVGSIPTFTVNKRTGCRDTVNLTYIQKDVKDVEIIVSAIRTPPLIGEVNLLRYLSRQFPEKNYEKLFDNRGISAHDEIFDLSHRLHYQSGPKEVHSLLSQLGEKLGNRKVLAKEEMKLGLADIAAWSTIKNLAIDKLPGNLSSWYAQCEKTFLHEK